MSLNRYRLRHLAENNHGGARRAHELLSNPEKLISLILLGNNFINILITQVATYIGYRLYGDLGIAIATGVLTLVLLLFAEATSLTDSELISLVRKDLGMSMGIKAKPYFSQIYRYPRGIPQYTLGHLDRLKTIDERLKQHSRLWVSGNSYRGISINACIEEAPQIAEEVLEAAASRDASATAE